MKRLFPVNRKDKVQKKFTSIMVDSLHLPLFPLKKRFTER